MFFISQKTEMESKLEELYHYYFCQDGPALAAIKIR